MVSQAIHIMPDADSSRAAKKAGLVYVSDHDPGIRRVRHGRGFRYLTPGGKSIRQPFMLARIRALAIPPAWDAVWICPRARGHIQATGRDARGRKQYLYHSDWRDSRDQAKYNRLVAFGEKLGGLRRRINRDLRQLGFPKEKVVATVVRLLQSTCIRVGNESYARANRSFGLTTLRDRHVAVEGACIHFRFKGKSGVQHAIDLHDPTLARIVKGCQDLPGQELFQYVDEQHKRRRIRSEDINNYLRDITGQDFTAKDFRTWAGTVLAAVALHEFQNFASESAAKRNIVQAIEDVAKRLGNTKTVCRRCYVHPAIIDAYLQGNFRAVLRLKLDKKRTPTLSRLSTDEAAVLAFLKQRLKTAN